MAEQILARRAGDEDAFRELTDPFRRELQLHVYRIVGSVQDAEDLLQETLLAAWRGLERFEGRASVVPGCTGSPPIARSLPPCEPAPPGRLAADDRDARADAGPSRSGSSPTPTSCSRASRTMLPDPRRATRQRGDCAGVHRRPSAPAAAAARGARAARRARLPRRRGRRECSIPPRPRPTASCAARVRRSSPGCPPPDANARRSRIPSSSATSSAASPTWLKGHRQFGANERRVGRHARRPRSRVMSRTRTKVSWAAHRTAASPRPIPSSSSDSASNKPGPVSRRPSQSPAARERQASCERR